MQEKKGGEDMLNKDLLVDKIKENGMTLEAFANEL